MRNLLILLIILSGPAALGVVGWGLMLIYHTAGLVVFVGCCAVIFIAALGFASLLDKRQQP
jgi:hypothetical protein